MENLNCKTTDEWVHMQNQIDILTQSNDVLIKQLSEADAREAALIKRLMATEKVLLEYVVYPAVTFEE